MPPESPPSGDDPDPGGFIWVLFEDGTLRPIGAADEPPGPDMQAGSSGKRWLRLARSVPIQPLVPKVAIDTPPARWAGAPVDAARQWRALPALKPVSAFGAALVLIRSLLVRHDEPASRRADIEALIRAGHAAKALDHLQQFQSDWPGWRPGVLGLFALAHHDLGDAAAARAHHEAACIEGSMHPAMIEIYGIPDLSWLIEGGANDSDQGETD